MAALAFDPPADAPPAVIAYFRALAHLDGLYARTTKLPRDGETLRAADRPPDLAMLMLLGVVMGGGGHQRCFRDDGLAPPMLGPVASAGNGAAGSGTCRFATLRLGGGTLAMKLVCRSERGSAVLVRQGRYSATSGDMTARATISQTGRRPATLTWRDHAERVGDCPA